MRLRANMPLCLIFSLSIFICEVFSICLSCLYLSSRLQQWFHNDQIFQSESITIQRCNEVRKKDEGDYEDEDDDIDNNDDEMQEMLEEKDKNKRTGGEREIESCFPLYLLFSLLNSFILSPYHVREAGPPIALGSWQKEMICWFYLVKPLDHCCSHISSAVQQQYKSYPFYMLG